MDAKEHNLKTQEGKTNKQTNKQTNKLDEIDQRG